MTQKTFMVSGFGLLLGQLKKAKSTDGELEGLSVRMLVGWGRCNGGQR